MKYVIALLILLTVGVWGYNLGALVPTVAYNPTTTLKETTCDDIIRYEDGSIVCEVDLQAVDEVIKIYK